MSGNIGTPGSGHRPRWPRRPGYPDSAELDLRTDFVSDNVNPKPAFRSASAAGSLGPGGPGPGSPVNDLRRKRSPVRFFRARHSQRPGPKSFRDGGLPGKTRSSFSFAMRRRPAAASARRGRSIVPSIRSCTSTSPSSTSCAHALARPGSSRRRTSLRTSWGITSSTSSVSTHRCVARSSAIRRPRTISQCASSCRRTASPVCGSTRLRAKESSNLEIWSRA